MKQGSRARHKQRYQQFTGDAVGTVSSRSSRDLQDELAMAAESSAEPAADLPAVSLVPKDLHDPRPSVSPERQRPARAHIEDDFFARGDEIALSLPPSSVDMGHLE